MKTVSQEDNFYFLFFALLALFFGSAVMQQFYPQGQKTVIGLIILTLFVSILGVHRKRAIYRSFYGVLLTVAGISYGLSLLETFDLTIVTLLTLLFVICIHIFSALKQVFLTSVISTNNIIGSICVYLLMGLAWSFIYLTILELFPNAFVGVEQQAWLTNFFHMLYFSFITLTTVGYGDVSPAIPLAKFFVFMQSIIGSFYVAILVASLVSAKLSQSN
ncbi:two pore domain potassium channel family protein [Vibrio ponticus]|uniref:Two pore domain potassium channel family protein n=1 Tax=Vibrio ponticus TaxID=265668 RepID=A0A3N3DZP2_9VIBR|nr:potassium channel family protein [Vibrio ponticus]ROV59836.1 two pore domain potassium channel family protein [Vibrio ponticus]